jgi:hypothetical protein
LVQHELTRRRRGDLSSLHDEDSIVPRFDGVEYLRLHRQRVEGYFDLRIFMLYPVDPAERRRPPDELGDLVAKFGRYRRRYEVQHGLPPCV